MAARNALTVQYLHRRLRYDAATGKLYWRDRPRSDFARLQTWASWTGRYAGKEALITVDEHGYLRGGIDQHDYFAHRIIFFMWNGWWPERIDHRNGCTSDNRLQNLTPSDPISNSRNVFRSQSSTSGFTGVTWDKRKRRWMAKITVDYRTIFLGYFNTAEEASTARRQANEQYGFSRRHGEVRK